MQTELSEGQQVVNMIRELISVQKELISENRDLTSIIKTLVSRPKEHERVLLDINHFKTQNLPQMKLSILGGAVAQVFTDILQLFNADTSTLKIASFANTSFVSDNPGIVSLVPDPANPAQVIATLVAAGVCNITSKADVTYTDAVTGQSVTATLQVVKPYTVTATGGTGAENVQLDLTPGAATVATLSPARRAAGLAQGR